MIHRKIISTFITAIILVIIFIFGCGKKYLKTLTAQEYFEKGEYEFKKKKYDKSILWYKKLVVEYPDNDLADDAQYKIAECNFYMKDYVSARSEYQELIKTIPTSEWVDDAEYKIGLCYYKESLNPELDQTDTKYAINQFKRLIKIYPGSDWVLPARKNKLDCEIKLLKKTFINGYIYRKLEHYEIAISYFNEVIGKSGELSIEANDLISKNVKGSDKSFQEVKNLFFRAWYEKGECYVKLKKWSEAKESFTEIEGFNDPKLVEKAKKKLKKINGKIASSKSTISNR